MIISGMNAATMPSLTSTRSLKAAPPMRIEAQPHFHDRRIGKARAAAPFAAFALERVRTEAPARLALEHIGPRAVGRRIERPIHGMDLSMRPKQGGPSGCGHIRP